MLVLSRQRDESVEIVVPASDAPTTILCTVVDIRGDKVRVGFDAPRVVTVHRSEVARDIRRNGAIRPVGRTEGDGAGGG